MRTVVFDLDGTLADTAADLIAAANACFAARDIAARLDPRDDALIAFHGGRAMLREGYGRAGLPEPELEAAIEADYQALLDHYGANICTHTTLYPGAREAVERLRRLGYRTAICTNKPEGLARTLVEALGITDLFDALVGADTLPVRKPDPTPYLEAVRRAGGDPRQSLLIGDTETDRRTAMAAGVPCILVTFGPAGSDVLRLSPDAILGHYSALSNIAERYLGRAI